MAMTSTTVRGSRPRQSKTSVTGRAPQRVGAPLEPPAPLFCFSHLRWKFVFQRPQHLLTRWARQRQVYYFEEPIYHDGPARLEVDAVMATVSLLIPHLPHGMSAEAATVAQQSMLAAFWRDNGIQQALLWYYSPMFLPQTRQLAATATVYDCMDELSGFLGAPSELQGLERALLQRADVVFTGGYSLYDAKQHVHANVHPCPSSVDVAHFAQARNVGVEPSDQAAIPHPRLGFFGVVDERFDGALIGDLAAARPDWHIVLVGPVVKIDPAILPRAANVHYLGMKSYAELPRYLAGWDVALLPFARNAATQFISPTKTPEYMAGGKPVVSTAIADVVRPYGEQGLVHIGDTGADFVRAIERIFAEDAVARQQRADAFLADLSWDKTFERMKAQVDRVVAAKASPVRVPVTQQSTSVYVGA